MRHGVNPATGRCRQCGRLQVTITTNGSGQLVEQATPCPCPKAEPKRPSYAEQAAEARKTGVCMDCEGPVEGTVGKALRCATHKRAAIRRTNNDGRKTPEARRKRRQYERRIRRGEAYRERRNARRRELHAERMANDPEYRERYRRRRQRETSFSHPGYERRIEYFRRTNAEPERAERKRMLAREAYYRENPVRPDPHCETCGDRIDYDGRGAPPKYHPTKACHPRWKYDCQGRAA